MKVSDYIVDFLIHKGITDVFGYPGGMVTHLMESFRIRQDEIHAHVTYHEQGAAFAACGYAQVSGKPGVAYATSGPGATNLITGICNAYFDSIPTIFITGQVNTNESKGSYGVRQRGFQETDIVSMVRGVTKFSAYVSDCDDIGYYLEKAYQESMTGRKGPVLLDIPMNVLRADVDMAKICTFEVTLPEHDTQELEACLQEIREALRVSERPCLLLGNGVKISRANELAKAVVDGIRIPCVTSMIAFDVLGVSTYNFGFIGAYGDRSANFIAAKCDLLICIGSRLDVRQVGARRECFAPDAKIIRIDIDRGELTYPIREDESQYVLPVEDVLLGMQTMETDKDYSRWLQVCNMIRDMLRPFDTNCIGNRVIRQLSSALVADSVITTDVGQNQVWVAQSLEQKEKQRILFSGGHGAMGYSLPAAIGAYYGSGKKPVYCISGDGGFQMNIQELQFVAREGLPIKMIVLNNSALGMIRHFQEMYFQKEEYQTVPEGGYSAPDFSAIAAAYGLKHKAIVELSDLTEESFESESEPMLLEIHIDEDTYVFPKLEFGKPNQDQEPQIDRELYKEIMEMDTKKQGGGGKIIAVFVFALHFPFHEKNRDFVKTCIKAVER